MVCSLFYLLLFSQITPYTKDGFNKICLMGSDPRTFCLGVRIVKRRTLQQVVLNSGYWIYLFLTQFIVFFSVEVCRKGSFLV